MTHILSIAEKLGNIDKMRQAYPVQNFYVEIEKAALTFLMGLKIADAYHIYEKNGNIFAVYLQYLNAKIPEATAEDRMAIEAQLEKLKDYAILQDMLAVRVGWLLYGQSRDL